MSNKMICPVCGKTELIRMFNPLTGEYFEDYDCPFRLCNFRGNKVAVDALIQAKTRLELINNSKFANLNNVLQIQSQCEDLKINKVLEQITALTKGGGNE